MFRKPFLACVFVLIAVLVLAPGVAFAEQDGHPVVVSLGDSYSSGEGTEPFFGQEHPIAKYSDKDWLAHRSRYAWSGQLKVDGVQLSSMWNEGWYFVAASGAETQHIMGDDKLEGVQKKRWGLITDVISKEEDLPCQSDIFSDSRIAPDSIDYVTLTIGGNDLGFTDVVAEGAAETAKDTTRAALEADYLVTGWSFWEYIKDRPGLKAGGLQKKLKSAVDKFKNGENNQSSTLERLSDVHDYVLGRAGKNATLIVAGYPHLFPDAGRIPFINSNAANLINSAVDTFDTEVRNMIRQKQTDRIMFADPRPYFANREELFINNVMVGPQPQDLVAATPVSAYSVHPNRFGQIAYARAVQDVIDNLSKSQPAQVSSGSSEADEPVDVDVDSDVAMSLVFDVSGSMDDPSALSGMTKLASAKKQSSDFVSSVSGDKQGEGGLSVRVGVCSFSSRATTDCGLSNDPDDINASIAALQAAGQTNMYAGLNEGITQLLGENGPRLMVFLSDGLSNVGGSRSDIIDLAREAADKDIKIYTIGFGSSSDIDEDLLQEIADITGGEYSHEDSASISSAAVGLFATMMNARLQAQYEILRSVVGAVGLGDLVDAGDFDITKNGTVQVYLYWPGSVLDMQLTDPDGTQVAEGYPGVTVDTSAIPTSITIENAKQGTWNMSVLGREVSMEEEPYYAVAAFEETEAPVAASGGGGASNGGEGLVFIMLVVAIGCIVGVYAFTKRRSAHE